MATIEFESHSPLFPSAAVSGSPYRHPSRAARKRLALISTYDDLCGIAAYTRSLEKQLNEIFDVTVFDLNQYLLRSAHSRVKKIGDKHIQDICREIREYDAVNIQLEHGTLGRSCRDIHRRFSWILRAAPRCSVTFHTIFECEAFDFRGFINEILRLNFAKAIAMRSAYNRKHLLSAGIASRLRRAQRFKPVTLIVHTGRDLSHMKFVHGMRNVHDHPLSFLTAAEVQDIRRAATRDKFAVLDTVPKESKLIGVFGFLGRYKGFDTVVRALHHLPKDYHLLIFGGVHPNEIKLHQPIDPVVSSLFDAGYVDTSVAERIREGSGTTAPAVSVAVDGRAVRLTRREFELLRYLVQNRNRVISRDRLLERVWGYDRLVETRSVDVHVGRLRTSLTDSTLEARDVSYAPSASGTHSKPTPSARTSVVCGP